MDTSMVEDLEYVSNMISMAPGSEVPENADQKWLSVALSPR